MTLLNFAYKLKVQENLAKYYDRDGRFSYGHIKNVKYKDTAIYMFFLAIVLPFIISAIIYAFVATLSNMLY